MENLDPNDESEAIDDEIKSCSEKSQQDANSVIVENENSTIHPSFIL